MRGERKEEGGAGMKGEEGGREWGEGGEEGGGREWGEGGEGGGTGGGRDFSYGSRHTSCLLLVCFRYQICKLHLRPSQCLGKRNVKMSIQRNMAVNERRKANKTKNEKR